VSVPSLALRRSPRTDAESKRRILPGIQLRVSKINFNTFDLTAMLYRTNDNEVGQPGSFFVVFHCILRRQVSELKTETVFYRKFQ
jgi:hypothetical protein